MSFVNQNSPNFLRNDFYANNRIIDNHNKKYYKTGYILRKTPIKQKLSFVSQIILTVNEIGSYINLN